MAPEPGGNADKLGNRYESVWTIRHALYVLRCQSTLAWSRISRRTFATCMRTPSSGCSASSPGNLPTGTRPRGALDRLSVSNALHQPAALRCQRNMHAGMY